MWMLFSLFLSRFISFNSLQTSALSLLPLWPPCTIGQQRDMLPVGSFSFSLQSRSGNVKVMWRQHVSATYKKKKETQKTAHRKKPPTACSSTFRLSLFTPPFSQSSHCKLIMFPNTIGHCLPTASGAATCWGHSARRHLVPSLWFAADFLTFC